MVLNAFLTESLAKSDYSSLMKLWTKNFNPAMIGSFMIDCRNSHFKCDNSLLKVSQCLKSWIFC